MARFISPLGRITDTKELSSSTDFTVDATTDIVLDADGGDILFKGGGTTIGEFTNSSSDLVIKSSVSDKDILVKGDSRNYFGNSMAFTNTVEGGADPLKKGTQIAEDLIAPA